MSYDAVANDCLEFMGIRRDDSGKHTASRMVARSRATWTMSEEHIAKIGKFGRTLLSTID